MFRRFIVIFCLVLFACPFTRPVFSAETDSQLDRAGKALTEALKGEKGVTVAAGKKGLTVTFISEVLFDSGKAELKSASKAPLSTVARIIRQKAPDCSVGIEGHTDNVPIKLSKWKSNWELSAARAVTVLHYLEKQGLPADRLWATGYGEHHPAGTNQTEEGRRKNRRVEIILLPKSTEKQKLVSDEER